MCRKHLPHCILAFAGLFLAGCGVGTGYQKVDGEWVYVTWDEGSGRRAHELHADKVSFRKLADARYAKDKHRAYFEGAVLQGADSATFQLIDEDYARDKASVFLFEHKIVGADPGSFAVIKPPYSKDATRFYCGTVAMDVLDPAAFEPVQCTTMWSTIYGKDIFLFEYGESFANLEISEESPAVVGEAWARDGRSYYYGPARLEGVDYSSFKIVDGYNSFDKNQSYTYCFPAHEFDARRERFLEIK